MAELTQNEIDKIAEALAPKLVDNVRKDHHDFWIDPERHYNDHQTWGGMSSEEMYEVKNLVQVYKATKSLWFKAFLGAAIIGTLFLAAVGTLGKGWLH